MDVRITNWRAQEKNTLRGFFTATMQSGMVINDCSLHEKDGKRWIKMAAREWIDNKGDTQYTPIVSFVDRESADRFRDLILSALDRHRKNSESVA